MNLTLTRAQTVYSLVQLEADEIDLAFCHHAAQGKGVLSSPEAAVSELKGSLLPLYRFPDGDGFASKRIRSFGDLTNSVVPDIDDPSRASSDDENVLEGSSDDSGSSSNQVVPQRSVLDSLLLAEWEDRVEQGLFRYDVTACPTKLLPGAYGFVAQENEGRASKKRATEFRIDTVDQPFDNAKFNFTKAMQQEVLFQFQPGSRRGPTFSPAALAAESPNLVVINVSPIEYGHVLLVPRVLDQLNQTVDPSTALLAMQFAREANNPYLRVGFNSLGAYGTINHLHFQAYYLAAPMPAERAPTVPLDRDHTRKRGFKIARLAHYPVNGLVFEVGDSLAEMAAAIGTACQRLTKANIPHNLLIVDSGARVFLFPNAFAERKVKGDLPEDLAETMVDPACWEIGGHIVLKRHQDYVNATEEWAWKLLEYASLPEERFAEVIKIACGDCA